MNIDRRNYLLGLTGLISGSLAGCITRRSGTVGDSIKGLGSDHVTISKVAVEQTFVYVDGAHFEVGGEKDRQYLFALGSESIDRKSLRLSLDDQRFSAQSSVADVPVSDVLFEGEQVSDPGLYAFELPMDVAASSAELRLKNGVTSVTWSLDDESISTLSNPPTFDVEAFTVPKTVTRGEDAKVTVRVSNRGHAGTFVAELGPTTRSDQTEIRLEVSSNGTRTYSTTVDTSVTTDDRITVVLDRGFDQMTRDIEIE